MPIVNSSLRVSLSIACIPISKVVGEWFIESFLTAAASYFEPYGYTHRWICIVTELRVFNQGSDSSGVSSTSWSVILTYWLDRISAGEIVESSSMLQDLLRDSFPLMSTFQSYPNLLQGAVTAESLRIWNVALMHDEAVDLAEFFPLVIFVIF